LPERQERRGDGQVVLQLGGGARKDAMQAPFFSLPLSPFLSLGSSKKRTATVRTAARLRAAELLLPPHHGRGSGRRSCLLIAVGAVLD
jgi:hypothetical protein